MDESNAREHPVHPTQWGRIRSAITHHLQKVIRGQGRNVSGEFLKGAAYKLGSGAVTLIIIWWETRR
ncbi:hypothetical protein ACFWPQ_49200 [Streptomyces sp. NPDC058464]|uniref:hypothetical protein n=1 Tax=Streptomyces sp. NPDC058464 TaxID=3346511 RepID=UPI00364F1972